MNPIVDVTKHAILRTISVICVLAVCALLVLGVKRILYPKPTESYAQKAESITNTEHHNYYDGDSKFFIGIKLMGLKFGISKIVQRKE